MSVGDAAGPGAGRVTSGGAGCGIGVAIGPSVRTGGPGVARPGLAAADAAEVASTPGVAAEAVAAGLGALVRAASGDG